MLFDDLDLLHGEAKHLADFLGVSTRTIQLYKSGKARLPEPSRRLLRLRREGDLSALLGSAWDGFGFGRDGLLYVPGWRNGMRPEQIRAMFFTNQAAAALRNDVKALQTEVWALRKVLAVTIRNGASLPISSRGTR